MNKELLEQIAISKSEGQLTERLFRMICEMVDRWCNARWRSPLTYQEPMKAYAIGKLTTDVLLFNEDQSDNPYAFIMNSIQKSFTCYLKKNE